MAADRPAVAPSAGARFAEPAAAGDHSRGSGRRRRAPLLGCRSRAAEPAAQAQKLPLDQIYPVLLERMVDGVLITEAGRKEHLDQDPDLKQRLKRYEDRLIQEAYLSRAIKSAETEDRLKARYETFVKEKAGQDEVHARHILVKTEAEAKSVIAELEKGADFSALAKKYSTDPGAGSGGDLGYFGRGDMVAPFAEAALPCPPASTPRHRSKASSAGM